MRLTPIDKPPSLLGKLMSFLYRRQLGRDITPARVIYNRVPAAWRISLAFVRFELFGARLSHELRLLATTHVAMLNGCAFCQDIKRAFAIRQRVGTERFDDRVRIELAYVLVRHALEHGAGLRPRHKYPVNQFSGRRVEFFVSHYAIYQPYPLSFPSFHCLAGEQHLFSSLDTYLRHEQRRAVRLPQPD